MLYWTFSEGKRERENIGKNGQNKNSSLHNIICNVNLGKECEESEES